MRINYQIDTIHGGSPCQKGSGRAPLSDRLDGVFDGDHPLHHFFVRHLGELIAVHVDDIIRLEADDDYTAVYAGGRRLMVHLPLRDMVARLDPRSFVRVHRCDVVHLAHVRQASQNGRRITLKMSAGSEVVSSRAGLQALQAFLP